MTTALPSCLADLATDLEPMVSGRGCRPVTGHLRPDCAARGRAGSGAPPLARRESVEFLDLPEPYLAKVLRMLAAGRIFASVPGVNGGCRLGRGGSDDQACLPGMTCT